MTRFQSEDTRPSAFWVWMAALGCSLITGIVTYTITITLTYASVKQDIALIRQQMDIQQPLVEKRLTALEGKQDSLVGVIEANTQAMAEAASAAEHAVAMVNSASDAASRRAIAAKDARHGGGQ